MGMGMEMGIYLAALFVAKFWCLLLRLTCPQVCNNFHSKWHSMSAIKYSGRWLVDNFATCHALMHN